MATVDCPQCRFPIYGSFCSNCGSVPSIEAVSSGDIVSVKQARRRRPLHKRADVLALFIVVLATSMIGIRTIVTRTDVRDISACQSAVTAQPGFAEIDFGDTRHVDGSGGKDYVIGVAEASRSSSASEMYFFHCVIGPLHSVETWGMSGG